MYLEYDRNKDAFFFKDRVINLSNIIYSNKIKYEIIILLDDKKNIILNYRSKYFIRSILYVLLFYLNK